MSGPSAQPVVLAVCVNTVRGSARPCCGARGALDLAAAMERGIRERRLNAAVKRIVCFSRCERGPNMRIVGGDFIHGVRSEDVPGLLDRLEALAGCRRETETSGMLYPGA